MPSTAEKNSIATKVAGDALYLAIFTADPGLTGTVIGELSGGTYTRVQLISGAAWSAPSGGVINASATANIPSGNQPTYAGLCTASTGNTLIDRVAITAPNYPVAGTLTVALSYTITP